MRMRLAALCLLATAATQAASLVYNPTAQTGDDSANVTVTLDDSIVAGKIRGTVTVLPDLLNPNVADIRAIYFNLNLPVDLTATEVIGALTGDDVGFAATNTNDVGTGSSMSPLGPFTIGFEIGSAGIGGGDDIQTTTFWFDNSLLDPDLTLAMFGEVGVRLQSVGAPTSNREGSAKLFGSGQFMGDDPTSVPEPSTYMMMASAIGALAIGRYRRGRA